MSLCIANMRKRYILANKDKKEYKCAIYFDLGIEKQKNTIHLYILKYIRQPESELSWLTFIVAFIL